MGAPRHILETALYADDLDAAERFYGSLLGLETVTRAGDRHVFFRCGDGMLLIFNAAQSAKPPSKPDGPRSFLTLARPTAKGRHLPVR